MMLTEKPRREILATGKKMALPSTTPPATTDAMGYGYLHLISLTLSGNYGKPWVEIGDILYINGTATEKDARRSQRLNHT
jgi:hypothetical protein